MNKIYIDTSTDELSIGLGVNGEVRTFISKTKRKMAEELVLTLRLRLKEFDLSLADVDEIYVTRGPGSFTGSRLGLTMAKTIMLLNPKVHIYLASTLDALLSCCLKAEIAVISMKNDSFFVLEGANKSARRVELAELQEMSQDREVVVIDSDELGYQKLKEKAIVHRGLIIDGMMKNKDIYELVEDPSEITPFYLRG